MQDSDISPGSCLVGREDRLVISVLADATRIAHALGLNINLPDSNNEDPAHWELVGADGGYKPRIADQIADPLPRDNQGESRIASSRLSRYTTCATRNVGLTLKVRPVRLVVDLSDA